MINKDYIYYISISILLLLRLNYTEAKRWKTKSLKNVKFFVSSRLPCYGIEEPWGLFYYGETLFPMLVTLIMINGASLGWDGAGHQARAKGLNIVLTSRSV